MSVDDDPSKEMKEWKKGFKKAGGKLTTFMQLYSPDEYPAEILKKNESKWLTKCEEAHAEILEVIWSIPDDASDEASEAGVTGGALPQIITIETRETRQFT